MRGGKGAGKGARDGGCADDRDVDVGEGMSITAGCGVVDSGVSRSEVSTGRLLEHVRNPSLCVSSS